MKPLPCYRRATAEPNSFEFRTAVTTFRPGLSHQIDAVVLYCSLGLQPMLSLSARGKLLKTQSPNRHSTDNIGNEKIRFNHFLMVQKVNIFYENAVFFN